MWWRMRKRLARDVDEEVRQDPEYQKVLTAAIEAALDPNRVRRRMTVTEAMAEHRRITAED